MSRLQYCGVWMSEMLLTSVLWGVDVGDVVDGGTCHWYSGRFTAAGTVVRLLPC
jgi:hypothetical protein